MTSLNLVIGNKNYSTWSLRPWILMKVKNISFAETLIRLDQSDSSKKIREKSPSGMVPALIDEGHTVWESLAIVEYLAEKFPDAGIWPENTIARSHARSISCEMHAGFSQIRSRCPMNLRRKFSARDRGEALMNEVRRIEEVLRQARNLYGQNGEFLYGGFCAADAMFTPMLTRFETYSIPVEQDTQDYMAAVFNTPAFIEWKTAGLKEVWINEKYEEDIY